MHEDEKWIQLFQHFLDDELKVAPEEFAAALEDAQPVPCEVAKKVWDSLAASLAKLKHQKKASFSDRLERIPDYALEWSSSYYAMAAEYWNLVGRVLALGYLRCLLQCVQNDFHPMNRLMRGIIELFSCSYSSVGTHVMYDTAVLEFRRLLARSYAVTRLLFVNLPPVPDMFSSVPHQTNDQNDTTDTEVTGSTPETLSVGSLEQLEQLLGPEAEPPSCSSAERAAAGCAPARAASRQDITLLETPCCDFIIHYLFHACYADLFTVYSERCEAMDRRYWERLLQLNAHTDAHLLRYFDVKG